MHCCKRLLETTCNDFEMDLFSIISAFYKHLGYCGDYGFIFLMLTRFLLFTCTVKAMENKLLTLAFVCRDREILLGFKKRGFGAGRWNGFGGKVENGETIEEGAKRYLIFCRLCATPPRHIRLVAQF